MCFVIGDGLNNYYQLILHANLPNPSIADVFYLAGYPFMFAAIILLSRQTYSNGTERLIDAGIVMLAGLALSWHFLISPYVGEHGLSTLARLVYVAYPLMDIALLYLLFSRLLFASKTRGYQLWLAASLVAMLVGDVVYDLVQLHSTYITGSPVDAMFLAEYVLIAAAALHPSVRSPIDPQQTDDSPPVSPDSANTRDPSRVQLGAASLSALVPPSLLLIAYSLGLAVNIPVLLMITIVTMLLVFVRVRLLLSQMSKQNKAITAYARSLEKSHTTRDELEATLRHRAFYDELTGLPNRALFKDRVATELRRAERQETTVALCFGDLDGFAAVNNTLGHTQGDQVLIQVGELLSSIVRPGDTVARLGGDEFVVLMTDVLDVDSALAFAKRIVKVLHHTIEIDNNRFELSMSVGVTIASADQTAEELVTQADAAMYEAKDAGKNCVVAFEPSMQYKLVRRLELTSGFNGALDRNEFTLQYQPVYDLTTSSIVGLEALLRWDHPKLGPVSPEEFIVLAEETGYIVPLGRHVLDLACQRAAKWNRGASTTLPVWVNLSRRQLTEPDLVVQIEAALARHGTKPNLLGLEVTENSLTTDPDHAASILTRLRRLGVQIAVDDFGTGYSSLGHLRQYPVDALKIDRSFVSDLTDNDPAAVALTQTIVQLAQNLHLDIVAEGIENDAQRQALITLGCSYGQGYLFGQPLTPTQANEVVSAQTAPAAPLR
jgi:diguanylate cyclase (GGDEF)-like protein